MNFKIGDNVKVKKSGITYLPGIFKIREIDLDNPYPYLLTGNRFRYLASELSPLSKVKKEKKYFARTPKEIDRLMEESYRASPTRRKGKYTLEKNINPPEFHVFRQEKGRMTRDLVAIFFTRSEAEKYLKRKDFND